MIPIDDLVGNTDAARRLVEWLGLAFDRPELVIRLGGSARLGVLIPGPEGVGKLTVARSAAAAAGPRRGAGGARRWPHWKPPRRPGGCTR